MYLQHSIESYLNEKSSVASNRLVTVKNPKSEDYNTKVHARYLEDNKSELYKIFPLREDLSKSTFNKYLSINGIYKNPYRYIYYRKMSTVQAYCYIN